MTNPHLGQMRRLPLNDLNTHHHNPRRGNIPAIAESLRVHGQFRPLVVNAGTHTGRPNEVLAGNHTLLAAFDLKGTDHAFTELDCYVIDVDEDEATRIVLADNRTSDLGSYDDEVLAELLDSLDDDLSGTGYDDDDLADLMAELEEHEDLSSPAGASDGSGDGAAAPERAPGLLPSRDTETLADGYADRGTRMFVLAYPYADYVWVAEQLAAYQQSQPAAGATNSDLLMHMLATANGVDLPHELGDNEHADDEEAAQ